jgi:nucleotide-binding universal stress UspA family protein
MRTIVVGYDGSAPAERALARAAELAQAFRSHIVVADVAMPRQLQAMPGGFGLQPYYLSTPDVGVQADEALWQQHRAQIEAFLAKTGVTHEFAGVVGAPVAEIVEIAAERNADLIVVGTRDPGFLERLLGGSVSQGVARRSGCDVLIVHSPERED